MHSVHSHKLYRVVAEDLSWGVTFVKVIFDDQYSHFKALTVSNGTWASFDGMDWVQVQEKNSPPYMRNFHLQKSYLLSVRYIHIHTHTHKPSQLYSKQTMYVVIQARN